MSVRKSKHVPVPVMGTNDPRNKEKYIRAGMPIASPKSENRSFEKQEHYNQHLATIVEFSDDAIISKSLDGTILSWNRGGEKMFGFTAHEAIGQHISLIIPPGYTDSEADILKRIRNNEVVEHFETIRSKKNGELFFVSLTVSPLKDQSGNITGVSKIARDISGQKKAAEQIKQLNEELERRIDQRTAQLLISNKELAFQNREKEKRAQELIIANEELAFQNQEKEKRAQELIIANEELAFQNQEKEQRAQELIIANSELVFQNDEKEKRAAESTIANQVLKSAEVKLMEVNKEMESFSYSVSHDLRAPLRAVHGYSKMLKMTCATQMDTEANRLADNIMHNAEKMGQLIDDLLTFSRIGRKELVKVDINMNDIVTAICEELKKEQPDRSIEFSIGSLLPAKADHITIKQVWLNLVSNAIKYSGLKDKSVIEIGCSVEGYEIIYHIKDNGAGFDMRYADKLFGVFQRLHSNEEFIGTGVGLALVQRIVSKHGGRVWAEGTVNKGAIFYFTLIK